MFTNKDKKFGTALSEEQKREFESFIDNLEGTERNMLCEDCHNEHGCGNDHDIHLADTGFCSICGKKSDVVNCAVANKVVNDNIPVRSYWSNGERIVNEIWLDKYLTKSDAESILKAHLESVYQTALNIIKNR